MPVLSNDKKRLVIYSVALTRLTGVTNRITIASRSRCSRIASPGKNWRIHCAFSTDMLSS